MICVTGDTHGDQSFFQDKRLWILDKSDTLIIAGDFGYIFLDSVKENIFLDRLEKEKYTICFVDGNHECFPAIYKYPEVPFKGGKAHKIRKNIFHLKRGEIYEIEGTKILAFGGAYSIDKKWRQPGVTVFCEELPNESEYNNCLENLKKCNNKVDYIITHQGPKSLIESEFLKPLIPEEKELVEFLEYIHENVEFKKWYFGHWHLDKVIEDKFRVLYHDIIALRN